MVLRAECYMNTFCLLIVDCIATEETLICRKIDIRASRVSAASVPPALKSQNVVIYLLMYINSNSWSEVTYTDLFLKNDCR